MQITLFTPEDITWPLGMQESHPTYLCGVGSYSRNVKVDPYPAYPHNIDLVTELANFCEGIFPLSKSRIGIWLLCYDFIDHLNGVTYEDYIYDREDGTEWRENYPSYDGSGKMVEMRGQALSIILSGKRIPIMPAMTRYLVTHEYGHAVFDYVSRRFGYKDHEQTKLQEEYMKIRGVENYAKKYRGGHWHEAPAEIIANDFRILFTKKEVEFWPHSCPPPVWDSPIGDWWKKAIKLAEVKGDIDGCL